jgi:hypothetical protein
VLSKFTQGWASRQHYAGASKVTWVYSVRLRQGEGLFFWFLVIWGVNPGPCTCRDSTTWATPPSLFALVIFVIESHVYVQIEPGLWSSLRFPLSWDDRCALPCSAFYWLRWVLATFCLGWPGIVIFPISTSGVARITGMRDRIQPKGKLLNAKWGWHKLFWK